MSSPKRCSSSPARVMNSIRIGAFHLDIPGLPSLNGNCVKGILKNAHEGFFSDQSKVQFCSSDLPDSLVPSSSSNGATDFLNLNLGVNSLSAASLVKRARSLGGCTRCFSTDHNCFGC